MLEDTKWHHQLPGSQFEWGADAADSTGYSAVVQQLWPL
jgi:hypothetical protein